MCVQWRNTCENIQGLGPREDRTDFAHFPVYAVLMVYTTVRSKF